MDEATETRGKVSGLAQAISTSVVPRTDTGSSDWIGTRKRIASILAELAHMQRVGGNNEDALLDTLAQLCSHGQEYEQLGMCALSRLASRA